MTFAAMTHWIFIFKMKRFPRHVNFKISAIKFLINNNKSISLTVCQGLRDSYNQCSLFRKGGIVHFFTEEDLAKTQVWN